MPCSLHQRDQVALDLAHQQAVLVLAGDEGRGADARFDVSSAAVTWAAEKFEQPIARTLPWRTRSSSARSVSSIGVCGSGKCTW